MQISQRIGLAAMMICTLLPIALSATGSRLIIVAYTAFVALPLLLACGLAWTGRRPSRQTQSKVLREKRVTIAACLLAVALVPLTHWPLRTAFALSRPTISHIAILSLEKAHRERNHAIAQDIERLKHPSQTGCEGYPDVFTLRMYAFTAGLPSEQLNTTGGTLALREMNPLTDHAMSLRVDAMGGSTELVYCSDRNTASVSSNAVPLGNGWWFVSD